MEAYKFETTVEKDGTIRIPEMSGLADRVVELFVVMKQPVEKPSGSLLLVDRFLDRWAGVLEGENPEQLKDAYLQEKYG
jgi:hypothetical protein